MRSAKSLWAVLRTEKIQQDLGELDLQLKLKPANDTLYPISLRYSD